MSSSRRVCSPWAAALRRSRFSTTWPLGTPSGSQRRSWRTWWPFPSRPPARLGVNMATYVGFITGGIPGALVATIGLVTPSIIIILIVAAFLKRFRDSKLVNAVFYGLRPASTAMVASAGVSVAALALVNTGAGRAGARQLEGRGARGRSARADALVQGHEGPAPDPLHPRKRRRRRGILVLSSSKKVHLF